MPIIIITAFGDLTTAVEAVRNGAFEYLLKPFDLTTAQRVIERATNSLSPPTAAAAEASLAQDGEGPIVGHSAAIQEVFKRIAVVAPSDACVHLRGESGTGKELAARAIHHYSRRPGGPFVAVNVASLSESLAESELFGHARGAFTGADQPRKGLLEQAHRGTIFLDEVADIPLPLQVKLLRVLEHGEILPVGADRPVQSDFRLISATHQDLRQRVAEGRFRHDLYFRLITFEIEIPPLRQRSEDIAELAGDFLDGWPPRMGNRGRQFPPRPWRNCNAAPGWQRPRAAQRDRTRHDSRPGRHHRSRTPAVAFGRDGGGAHFPGRGNPLAGAPMGGAAASRSGRRRRPLRSAAEMCGATALTGRNGALRGPMPGRCPPPRVAPHDPPQKARRTGNRRFLSEPHEAVRGKPS